MIKFYNNRDFGSFITDSFGFFKTKAGNYFKNFLLINGMVLILLIVVIFFGFKDFLGEIFNKNFTGGTDYFEKYLHENLGLMIINIVLVLAVYSLLMILNLLYPVFYLKRIAQGQDEVEADEIISDLKTNFTKIIKLYLGLILLVIPAAALLLAISYVMVFFIIGIPVLLFVVPTLFNAVLFLVYDYIYTERGFFGSLSYALRSQFSYQNGREKSPYWKYWGSTTILFLMYNVVTTIFMAIPALILLFRLTVTTSSSNINNNPLADEFGVLITFVYGISIVISAFLMNVLYVNAGFQYFDSRRDLHQKNEFQEIDTIGLNA